jgi:hypothetical protein
MRVSARILRIAGLSVVLPLIPAAASPVSAQQMGEERAVIEVVEKLFTAMRARDTVAMKSVFTADARLVGQVTRDGTTQIQVTPVADFISGIASIPPDREIIERIYEPSVRIDGDLASFWAFYTLHLGEQFSHCGVDAAHLFRTSEGWKIASLADTRRRENCDVPTGGD